MAYTLLVFVHLLASSLALGAIVATDLRLLSKLAQDKVRIAPPNEFVTRLVMIALLLLYATGALIVWHGVGERADYLSNPKLQAKILLVVALTLNAFVLHHVTFPRLARGRRVPRWTLSDWAVVAVPVAVSNFLWMFVAFLGVARPWNYGTPMRDILEIAAALYVVTQIGVVMILAVAGRKVMGDATSVLDRLARSLAHVGSLGRTRARASERSAALFTAKREALASGRDLAAVGGVADVGAVAAIVARAGAAGAASRRWCCDQAEARRALARAPTARPHHRIEEAVHGRRHIAGAAGVHRRGLDHGAARRHQPVEALASRERAERAGRGVARAHLDDGIERCADGGDVGARVEGEDARGVELDAGGERLGRVARHDHADVDELAALDARHDADDRVVIRERGGHERPP